jgi:hypothetical protein
MSISSAQLMEIQNRLAKDKPHLVADAVSDESSLHDQISEYCRGRGWYFVHSRMDRRTTTKKGVTDFIIAGPNGITLWIECKRRGSKPTQEQLAAGMVLTGHGHVHAIVYSFREFLEVVERS